MTVFMFIVTVFSVIKLSYGCGAM